MIATSGGATHAFRYRWWRDTERYGLRIRQNRTQHVGLRSARRGVTAPAVDPVIIERAIAERMARGDIAALEAFYDLHCGLAFAVALRMLGDRPSAEEAVQDAFHNVWRGAPRFDVNRGSLKSWLLTVLRNRCVDMLRARGSRPVVVSDEYLDVPAADHDIADVVERADESGKIRAAMTTLPDDQRRAIELAYFGGYSQTEIASLLQVPLGTIKGRIRLGMERLRSILVPELRAEE